MNKISINLLTYNSRRYLPECLAAVRAQTYPRVEVTTIDNGSADDTVPFLSEMYPDVRLIVNDENRGYSAAHNQGIGATDGEYVLLLNPDVVLEPEYVARLAAALDRDLAAGSAMGKLYALQSRGAERCVIDSVGVYVCRNRRTLDRGQGEVDQGQYDGLAECFGASGAAPMYRRAMLKDAAVDGEYFDEDFFAYREEVDLAWRAQLLGWSCAFVPSAVAYHDRSYTPEARHIMPRFLRLHMAKNRYLLLLKNDDPKHVLLDWPDILWFEVRLWAYSLLREPYLFRSLWQALRLAPRMLAKRRITMRRRRTAPDYMLRRLAC